MLNVLGLRFSVGDVPCRLVTIHPDNRMEPGEHMHYQHSHSGCELHYVSRGQLTVDCIGASYPLSAGQMLLIPPGVYHYVRRETAQTSRMDLLVEVQADRPGEASPLVKLVRGLCLGQPLVLEEGENPELFSLLKRIWKTAREDLTAPVQQEWLRVLCQELVLTLGAAAERLRPEGTAAPREKAEADTDRYIMDQFFNHNYHGGKRMEDLARELNLSVRQTGRVLRKTYGKGFREKMNECRLAVALDLLRNTDRSMAGIAETLGYGEQANFSCFIKSQTGKTPAQLRKDKT